MARPSNTEERRAQITGALLKVMAKQGYDGASVADVAREADLAPGLVHYHFKNKLEILLAALRDIVARHGASLEARLASVGGDPAAEVGAFIDFHLGLGQDADPEALACWILFSGEALRQPEVRVAFEAAMTAIVDQLAAIVRRGVASGAFECEEAGAAASAIVAAIQGYYVMGAAARRAIPKGSAAPSTKKMAAGLLTPARPPSAPTRGAKAKGPRRAS